MPTAKTQDPSHRCQCRTASSPGRVESPKPADASIFDNFYGICVSFKPSQPTIEKSQKPNAVVLTTRSVQNAFSDPLDGIAIQELALSESIFWDISCEINEPRNQMEGSMIDP
eukprot:1585938-Rhodomonas_salina.3